MERLVKRRKIGEEESPEEQGQEYEKCDRKIVSESDIRYQCPDLDWKYDYDYKACRLECLTYPSWIDSIADEYISLLFYEAQEWYTENKIAEEYFSDKSVPEEIRKRHKAILTEAENIRFQLLGSERGLSSPYLLDLSERKSFPQLTLLHNGESQISIRFSTLTSKYNNAWLEEIKQAFIAPGKNPLKCSSDSQKTRSYCTFRFGQLRDILYLWLKLDPKNTIQLQLDQSLYDKSFLNLRRDQPLALFIYSPELNFQHMGDSLWEPSDLPVAETTGRIAQRIVEVAEQKSKQRREQERKQRDRIRAEIERRLRRKQTYQPFS